MIPNLTLVRLIFRNIYMHLMLQANPFGIKARNGN